MRFKIDKVPHFEVEVTFQEPSVQLQQKLFKATSTYFQDVCVLTHLTFATFTPTVHTFSNL